MDRQFPPEIKLLLRSSGIKTAFISDIPATNPNECRNCGGVGTLTLFIGTKGPFQSPSSSRDDCNKYEDGVGWWVGQHHSVKCPVCEGIGVHLTGKVASPADIDKIRAGFRRAAFDRGE